MVTYISNKSGFSAARSRRVREKRNWYRKLVIAVNIALVLLLFPAAVWGRQMLAATGTAPATAEQVPTATGTAPATAGQVLTEAGQISTTTGQVPAAAGQAEKAAEAVGGPQTPGVRGTGDDAVQADLSNAYETEIRRAGKAVMPDFTILLTFASTIILFAGVVIIRTELEREKKRRRKRTRNI